MIPAEELRALVGLSVGDASKDELLASLEAEAVDLVALKARTFLGESADATDRIIGDGTARLSLPRWPVTAVASVTEIWPFDSGPTPLPLTDFILRDDFQLWRTNNYVWADGYEYAVTYTAGYAVGGFPAVYLQAVKDIVSARYPVATAAAAGASGETLKTETLGPFKYEVFSSGADASAAESDVKSILSRLPMRIRT